MRKLSRAPQALLKVSCWLASVRAGTAPHSQLLLTPGFFSASLSSSLPLGSQASFSRTKSLAAVQGRIMHQSPPTQSPWGVSFQACISAPGEQRKLGSRASFLFLPILRSCSRDLLVTCKVGHMPWERREGDRVVVPSAQLLWPSSVCCQRLPFQLEGNSNATLTRAQNCVSLSASSA